MTFCPTQIKWPHPNVSSDADAAISLFLIHCYVRFLVTDL